MVETDSGYHNDLIMISYSGEISGFGERPCCKIYVANTDSSSVSVIDGNSDTVKKTIPLCVNTYRAFYSCIAGGALPTFIMPDGVSEDDQDVAGPSSLSVIHNDTLNKTITLQGPLDAFVVGGNLSPTAMLINWDADMSWCPGGARAADYASEFAQPYCEEIVLLYTYNTDYNSSYAVDLINGTVKQTKWIPFTQRLLYEFLESSDPGTAENRLPTMVSNFTHNVPTNDTRIYVVNDNGTVSMADQPDGCDQTACVINKKHIVVGHHPGPIAINDKTNMVYIGYPQAGTLSVIDGLPTRLQWVLYLTSIHQTQA